MGKLNEIIVHERVETRCATQGEFVDDCGAIAQWVKDYPSALEYPILRRLPDDEAEELQTAREECEALRDMVATRDHEILAMKERHAGEIARLEQVIAVLNERPKVEDEEVEIERMAWSLFVTHCPTNGDSDAPLESQWATAASRYRRAAAIFVAKMEAERNRRRAERGKGC